MASIDPQKVLADVQAAITAWEHVATNPAGVLSPTSVLIADLAAIFVASPQVKAAFVTDLAASAPVPLADLNSLVSGGSVNLAGLLATIAKYAPALFQVLLPILIHAL